MVGKVYCSLIDASKALDKVIHNGLFVKLLHKRVSVKFVHIMQNWYNKSYMLQYCGMVC